MSKGPIIADSKTILPSEEQGETFTISCHISANQSITWPLDCWLIGVCQSTNSSFMVSRDGTVTIPVTTPATLVGINGQIISTIYSSAPLMGLKVRLRSGDRLSIGATSSGVVTFICRHITT